METINLKIRGILDWITIDSFSEINGREEAAKEIEKLILQEKVDMIEKFAPEIKDKKYTNPFIYQDVIKLHSELTTELNKLK